MPVHIQLRRGSALDWYNTNPVIAEGELCVELDTRKFKIGDGATHWRDLPYSTGIKGDTGTAATITLGEILTGSPGSSVVISNTGTFYDAVLNFTIPRGDKGDTGTQINKVIDIPDVNSTGLTNGALLVYNSGATRWDTTPELTVQNIDAGEF
jgi:hypothetical protein